MKREKIQLTVNRGFNKEVLLQGTSHPLKVVVFNFFIYTVLMYIWDIKTSSYVHYSVFFLFLFQEKGRHGDKLSFMHEAVVENWSSKDFNFSYSVSFYFAMIFLG